MVVVVESNAIDVTIAVVNTVIRDDEETSPSLTVNL